MDNKEFKNQNLEKFGQTLNSLEQILPRESLFQECLMAIDRKILFRFKLKLAGLFSVAAFFVVYIAFNWQILTSELFGSEIAKILSLFFTDFGVILANWQPYSLYLLEAFPVWPIALALTFILLTLLIIKIIIEKPSYKQYMPASR